MTDRRRYVFLVEMTVTKPWSSTEIEQILKERLDGLGYDPTVWGVISSVDAAYRKLRQLSRETEEESSYGDRVHSAHKAMSFFRDMFPKSFWKWKLIGEPHPTESLPGR